jgi:hypothetical protein
MAVVALTRSRVWKIDDHGTFSVPGSDLARGPHGRDPLAAEARLAAQFVALNRPVFDPFEIDANAQVGRDGRACVNLRSGSLIGALPLRSPVSGAVEHGLVIGPRFGWSGIGQMLSGTGARVEPQILASPLLPRSELGIPPWVLAAVVLHRLERLLRSRPRRFAEEEMIVDRPRGRVRWGAYVSAHLAVGHPERVPCVFAPLQDDQRLLGAVHAAVLKQIQSLASVRSDSVIVRRLLARYDLVRQSLSHVPPCWQVQAAPPSPMTSAELAAGIEAMEWTRTDRGLAGLSPTGGLSWRLPMEEVFEAWVEVLVRDVARINGGSVRTGRQRETLRPLQWRPLYKGSQRYLLPDVELLHGDDELVVFDAKYKAHWEEIDERRWHGARDETREAHRADLLQVLAYAAASAAQRITCVLVYPCHESTWRSLQERGRCWHLAEVPAGGRTVRLILLAVPLAGERSEIAAAIANAIRSGV